MASLTVSGICRITRDAEVRKSGTGTWYGIGIAAYRKNVKEGKQSVDFFDADLYQKNPIPGFENGLKKGKLIYIENAYLRNDQFTGTDGKEKSRVKIQISTFELLNDNVNPGQVTPEPPKYEKSKQSNLTCSPSDLPPPVNVAQQAPKPVLPKVVMPKPEEVIPDFPENDDEPPF